MGEGVGDLLATVLAGFITGGIGASVLVAYLLRKYGSDPRLKTRRAGWTILLGAFLCALSATYLLVHSWL